MVLRDADPVEAEFVGHSGVVEPALEALLRNMGIALVRQDAGPVSAGASVMSTTQERSFHGIPLSWTDNAEQGRIILSEDVGRGLKPASPCFTMPLAFALGHAASSRSALGISARIL